MHVKIIVVKYLKGYIFLPIILAVVLVLFIVFIIYQSSSKSSDTNGNLPTPFDTVNLKQEQISLTGMVWTSGLVDYEQEVLNLTSEYQLVKSIVSDGWLGKITGMFLISNNSVNLETYLGKCVTVNGEIKYGWENLIDNNYEINGKWTYYRSALVVDNINTNDINSCIGDYDRTIKDKKLLYGSEYKTTKGTLGFARRLTPDMGYDLEILLDEPFTDELNASGNSIQTGRLDISSGSSQIFKRLISNIGKKVEVSGYMEWGYAESRFLSVDKLEII